MRVIAGAARGRPLAGPAGEQTRPTSDKVKGALFSMLEALLARARPHPTVPMAELLPGSEDLWVGLTILDLYAGTGALGIEALSRGAAWCDFIEANSAARRVIERNLTATGLNERARIFGIPVERVTAGTSVNSLHSPYGVVLADPPYADTGVGELLVHLAGGQLLETEALVAVEHSRRVNLNTWYSCGEPTPSVGSEGLSEVRKRQHGDTVISIYRRVSEERKGEDRAYDSDLSREL